MGPRAFLQSDGEGLFFCFGSRFTSIRVRSSSALPPGVQEEESRLWNC